MGEERKLYKVLVGSPKQRDHLEERCVDERMGSELILLVREISWWKVDSVGLG
jgi:hypothetical protein